MTKGEGSPEDIEGQSFSMSIEFLEKTIDSISWDQSDRKQETWSFFLTP